MPKDAQEELAEAEAESAMREARERDEEEAAKQPEPSEDATATPVEVDEDVLELARFREEAAAEEVQAEQPEPTPEPEPEPEPTPEPESEPEEEEEEEPAAAASQRIPRQRFNEAVGKERERAERAMAEAAYYKGMADALRQGRPQEGEPGQPDQQTPAQKITALREEQVKFAQQYEDGELEGGYVELRRRDAEIEDQIYTLRGEEIAARQNQTRQPSQQDGNNFVSGMVLEELTAQLEDQHPFAREGVLDEDQWNLIHAAAQAEIARQNISLTPGNPQSSYQVRKMMAEMADRWGPSLTGKTREDILQQPAAQPAAKPNGATRAARQAKQALAGAHPPDITNRGQAAGGQPHDYTEQQIERMSDDDIMALPKSTRDRIMQGSA